MGRTPQFIGKYYSACSASEDLDIDTINAGCDIIDQAAADFVKAGKKVEETTDECGADALEVDGTTMIDSIENCANEIIGVEADIKSITQEIRNSALNKYNELQAQLNEAAERRNEEERQKVEGS